MDAVSGRERESGEEWSGGDMIISHSYKEIKRKGQSKNCWFGLSKSQSLSIFFFLQIFLFATTLKHPPETQCVWITMQDFCPFFKPFLIKHKTLHSQNVKTFTPAHTPLASTALKIHPLKNTPTLSEFFSHDKVNFQYGNIFICSFDEHFLLQL